MQNQVIAQYFHLLEDEEFLTQTIVAPEINDIVCTLINGRDEATVTVNTQDGRVIYRFKPVTSGKNMGSTPNDTHP